MPAFTSQTLPSSSDIDLHSPELIRKKTIVRLSQFDEELGSISDRSIDTIPMRNPRQFHEHWDSPVEFFFTCIGFTIGLGDLWRFPYLCMRYGGDKSPQRVTREQTNGSTDVSAFTEGLFQGAFLIPYWLCLILCGIPLYLMEAAVGQSTGLSTIRVFRTIPLLQGLGWCMVVVSIILAVHYNVIIAWALYILGSSFQWDLPWNRCNNSWNTPTCFTFNSTRINTSWIPGQNPDILGRSAAGEFWHFEVLHTTPNSDTPGGVHWKLLLALISAWICTFALMCNGIRSRRKIMYAANMAPYLLLTVILIRGCTLDGSWDGVRYFIIPDVTKLMNIETWVAGGMQVFYSLGPVWGGLITFASYNRFNYNIYRDSISIPIISGLTSMYVGFAVFSIVGHLKFVTKSQSFLDFTQTGLGTTLIVYIQAMTYLPGSAIWSVMFLLMFITVGLDSQRSFLESIMTGFADQFPLVFGQHKLKFTVLLSTVECLFGFIFITRSGVYYIGIINTYGTTYPIVLLGFLETIIISYLYGSRRLLDDLENMIGRLHQSSKYWWFLSWSVFVPLLCVVLLIGAIYAEATVVNTDLPSAWSSLVGWMIAAIPLLLLPIMAFIGAYQQGCSFSRLLLPDDEWRFNVDGRESTVIPWDP